jgi:hypothetical protein
VTLAFRHDEALIGCFKIPPGPQGWRTSRGPTWEFRDKDDHSLGDPDVREKVKIKFDAEKKRFELKVRIDRAEFASPEFFIEASGGRLSTSVIIGDEEFLNMQRWRLSAKGTKLIVS